MEARKILATELKAEDLEGKELKMKYEANEVDQWQLYFDGEKLHLITADCVPTSLLDMEDYSVEKGMGDYTVRSFYSRGDLLEWMKNKTKWKKFASGIPGATATGGPTVEQFCGCWNAMNKYQKIVLGEYCIKLKNPGKLFVPLKEGRNDYWGYWLASAYERNNTTVWKLDYDGFVCSDHYSSDYGTRPLVTLPSDIGLQYDEERKMWLIV